jgi:streptogramin lyase
MLHLRRLARALPSALSSAAGASMHGWRLLGWILPALFSTLLIACGGGGSGAAVSAGTAQPLTQQVTVQGTARAGTQVLHGASLTVYATAASEQSPHAIGQTTTGSDGAFHLSVPCAENSESPQEIYVVLSDGLAQPAATGQSANAAIRLVAMLGDCQQMPATLTINELTTVAAAYALNAFIQDDAIGGSAPGLPNAIATLRSLVNPATGALAVSLPTQAACMGATRARNCEATEKLDTLANALAACAVSTSSSSSECAVLFRCATAGATGIGSSCVPPPSATSPTDTWQAIISIARHPGIVSSAGIYSVATTSATYVPVLTAVPTDWSLALTFIGGGLSEPTALSVDGAGNIWVANYDDAVSEFSPTGAALSPSDGFRGGGLEESFGLAIDANGNVWVCNEQSPAAINAGLGSVTELAPNGAVLSDATGFAAGGLDFPEALMVDAAGHIWIANYGNSTLTELSGNGMPVSPEPGFKGGGMSFPVGISAGVAGNIWIVDQGANRVSAFSTTGAALSPASGYTGGGLKVPQGIGVDRQGNVWISNYYGNSLSVFSNQGLALSPSTGYVGAGLDAPGGIAIDGAGQVWVANFDGASISELTGSAAAAPGSALSPPSGFTIDSLLQPFAVAIDPSGNLWVSNFGNDSLTEFIGIAAPVATPVIGVAHPPN